MRQKNIRRVKSAIEMAEICETYYVTEYGECYHSRLGCSGLKRSVKRMTINEAVAGGYGVCSRCGGGNE